MKNYCMGLKAYLIITMLLFTSVMSVTVSKSEDQTNPTNINIEKYVKLLGSSDYCAYNDGNIFQKLIYANLNDIVQFKLYVNNTGSTSTNINLIDNLPLGLTYNNHAMVDGVAQEPIFLSMQIMSWNLSSIDPGQSKVITFLAIVKEYGIHINVAYLAGSSESQIYSYQNSATVEVTYNEPEIIIEKTVWNGNEWAEYAEVSLNDNVQFKGVVKNPTDCDIEFSGVIYDIFPNNLRYVNNSCTLLDLYDFVVEVVDYGNNSVYWHRVPVIPPHQNHTFYFNATAVDCGLGTNNIYTQAYVVCQDEEKIPVSDSDDAIVNVTCFDEPEISIKKMVWNGCEWVDYAEVSLGDTVQFRVEIYNPNDEYIIRFSGYIYDLFPNNLRYDEGSLIVLREDNVWIETIDWEKNLVNWSAMEKIYPGDYLNFTFNATAVDCGLGVNNIFVVSSTKVGETVVFLNGSDSATVDVECPDEPGISVEKSVKETCGGEFRDYVTIYRWEGAIFRINVTNSGETLLDITVRDALPPGLIYDNNAQPFEPDLIDGNYTWFFDDVNPHETISVTFFVVGALYGEHINLVNVTGITDQQETVYDEDNATVNVVQDEEEPELEINIDRGFNIAKLNAFIKNNKETNLNDITWDISIKNIGFFKKIESFTSDTIDLLEPNVKKTLKTESINGFGKVKIILKATAPEIGTVTTTTTGFVIGRIIIAFPSK